LGWLLGLTGTVLLFVALLSRSEPAALLQALRGTRLDLLGLSCILSLFVRFLLQPWRWLVILRIMGHTLPAHQMMFLCAAGYPLRFGTPGKLGAVVDALWLDRRHGVSLARGLSSIALQRAHNLLLFLSLALAGLAAFPFPGADKTGRPALFAALALSLLLAGVGATWLIHRPLTDGMARVSQRLARWFEDLLASLTKVNPRQQAGLFLFSALILAVELSGVYIIYFTVSVNLSYPAFVGGVAAATIVSNLPVTVGGFGTREAATAVLFSGAGSHEAVLCAGMLWSAFFYLLPLLIGLPFVAPLVKQAVAHRQPRQAQKDESDALR